MIVMCGKRQEEHLERAKISRQTYKSDVKKNKDKNQHYFSMDMQKIMMLPHLPGIKTAAVYTENFND